MYGAFIRQLRESQGMTQLELAETIGTSQPTLSAYEHDRKAPSGDTLAKIVAGCGYVLTAVAGNRSIPCPFPRAGWFDDDDSVDLDTLQGDASAVAGSTSGSGLRFDAPADERVEVVYAVLSLADSLASTRGAR